MLSPLQAPCGLDCAACEAYQATQANDEALKRKVLAQWQKDYSPDVPLSAIDCDGCVAAGCRKGGYTGQCPVRTCATAKRQPTCAHCPEYGSCETLQGFLAHADCLREKLEAIRATLG